MVAEGWRRVEIGSVCSSIIDCVNKTAPVIDGPTPYKMIRTTNVRDGKVNLSSVRYVSEDTFRIWTRRGNLEDGDIILTREAPVGEVGRLLEAEGCFLGQRTMVYRANPEFIFQGYLYQVMISDDLKTQYLAASAGGTVAHIRVPDCGKFLIPLPPLQEQYKIADILSSWDRAIAVAGQQLDLARTQKRALMQTLLTPTRRFPGFDGQPWKEVRLGDVVSGIPGGGTPDRSVQGYWGNEIPWVSVKDLKGDVISQTQEAITQTGLEMSACNAYPAGTIIIATRMAVGACAILSERMAINQDLKAILPNELVRNKFLFHLLKARQAELATLGTGSTVKGITLDVLKAMKINLPTSLNEQQRTAEVLDDADAEITILEAQITRLQAEKKALMQQLLTGKKRLAV